MTAPAVLLSDQVFQINVLLWSLEELPDGRGPIEPVLRNAGYYLNSIGRRLTVPVAEKVRTTLRTAGIDDLMPTNPDLWLRHETDLVLPLIELKAHSFDPPSSNSRQASKMLVSSVDLASSVGTGKTSPGHLIYVTPAQESDAMLRTLSSLSANLTQAGATVAKFGVVGLSLDERGLSFARPSGTELPGPMAKALEGPAVVLKPPLEHDDIRPLYFIPWMPGIDDSQDSALRSDGLRELTARVLAQAIAIVGRSITPTNVAVRGDVLLTEATFGIFSKWRDNDRAKFVEAAHKVIVKALRGDSRVSVTGTLIEIDLPSTEAQDEVLKRLEDADPTDRRTNLEGSLGPQDRLFGDEVFGAKD